MREKEASATKQLKSPLSPLVHNYNYENNLKKYIKMQRLFHHKLAKNKH